MLACFSLRNNRNSLGESQAEDAANPGSGRESRATPLPEDSVAPCAPPAALPGTSCLQLGASASGTCSRGSALSAASADTVVAASASSQRAAGSASADAAGATRRSFQGVAVSQAAAADYQHIYRRKLNSV